MLLFVSLTLVQCFGLETSASEVKSFDGLLWSKDYLEIRDIVDFLPGCGSVGMTSDRLVYSSGAIGNANLQCFDEYTRTSGRNFHCVYVSVAKGEEDQNLSGMHCNSNTEAGRKIMDESKRRERNPVAFLEYGHGFKITKDNKRTTVITNNATLKNSEPSRVGFGTLVKVAEAAAQSKGEKVALFLPCEFEISDWAIAAFQETGFNINIQKDNEGKNFPKCTGYPSSNFGGRILGTFYFKK